MLVDTSVWIDHFRKGSSRLAGLLGGGEVECHPFVVGELACGRLERRGVILDLFSDLPRVPVASHREALTFVELHELSGRGLGWIDVHLLASARLGGTSLWTLDRRLASAARELGVGS